MEFYQVGGCVRDELLGLEAGDRDWVVTGATPEQLENEGYRAVGRDFPVFLHPQSHEEYALARTERKTAPGYRGFAIHAAPEVTLEDDLARRDLTINAIARRANGELIDPFGGLRDLEDRWLRHVSPAFVEDPVRILRAARFAARFAAQGFRIHPDTLRLMSEMVEAGEVSALVPERVWAETRKAFSTARPDAFVSVLRDCGALAVIFPELDALFGVPQPPRWHPEVDTGVHMLMVLRQAATLSQQDPLVVFAAFCHDFGKGTTPPEKWPSHPGHEARSAEMLIALTERLRVPKDFRDVAVAVARHHGNMHRAFELRPSTLLRLLEQLDVLRRPDRLPPILLACEADYRGRQDFEDKAYPQADLVRACREAAASVRLTAQEKAGLEGVQIGEAIRNARLAAVRTARQAFDAA